MTEPKSSIADRLNVAPYDESLGANLDRAAEAAPVVGTVYKSGKSIAQHAQELGHAQDIGDVASAAGSLVGDGAKFVSSAALDMTTFAMDPIGWLVGHGLNMLLELVQPLQDALHQVTGDGPAIGHASDNFVTIGQGFVALAADFEATGDNALKDWQDEAGEAARAALADFSVGIRGIGSCAGSVAEVLQMWSMVMVIIEEVIKAIITELVSWLITIWLPALASSVITFGGSVAAAMTASVAKAASVFAKVTKHLGKLGKLLDTFMQFLVKVAGTTEKLAHNLRVGKLVTAGDRQLPVIGNVGVNIGRVAKESKFIPSDRVVATAFGADAGALAKNLGIKPGIAVAKTVPGEGLDTLGQDGREIGGDHSVDETRKNLDM
jgi:hypothetical protein